MDVLHDDELRSNAVRMRLELDVREVLRRRARREYGCCESLHDLLLGGVASLLLSELLLSWYLSNLAPILV